MVKKLKLALRGAQLMLSGKYADSAKDYDKASGDYDSFFSSTMGKYSIEVLRKMNIEEGMNILELACGTGFLTVEMARLLNGRGAITTVDQSLGMLNIARQKLSPFTGIKLNMQQGDMMELLRSIPSDSVDIVVCGWAICYIKPVEFFKEVKRVLKPKGQVGIIETRIDSEELVMQAFEKVLEKEPSYLQRYIKLELPANTQALQKWFAKGGLNPVACWEGEEILACNSGDDAVEWVQRSGAAAGYIDVIDRQREQDIIVQVREEIDTIIKSGIKSKLSHTYVAGVANKEAV